MQRGEGQLRKEIISLIFGWQVLSWFRSDPEGITDDSVTDEDGSPKVIRVRLLRLRWDGMRKKCRVPGLVHLHFPAAHRFPRLHCGDLMGFPVDLIDLFACEFVGCSLRNMLCTGHVVPVWILGKWDLFKKSLDRSIPPKRSPWIFSVFLVDWVIVCCCGTFKEDQIVLLSYAVC